MIRGAHGIVGSALLLTGCAHDVRSEIPRAPDPLDAAATVVATIDAPIDDVFDYVVREDTPETLGSYGPIPAVKGSVKLDGSWDRPGVHRTVVLDGGGTLREEITAWERPRYFAYRIDTFTSSLGALAREGRGTWRFVPKGANGERTEVTWTYAFRASACPKRPALGVFVGAVYRPFMRQGMNAIKLHLERASVSVSAL